MGFLLSGLGCKARQGKNRCRAYNLYVQELSPLAAHLAHIGWPPSHLTFRRLHDSQEKALFFRIPSEFDLASSGGMLEWVRVAKQHDEHQSRT